VDATIDAFVADPTAFEKLPARPPFPFRAAGQEVLLVSTDEGRVVAAPGLVVVKRLRCFVSLVCGVGVGSVIVRTIVVFTLARARARADLARNERLRTDKLVESGAVSRQESDERISTEKDTEAAVRSAEASLATAKLDLGYTRVLAPIPGRSGRAEVTAGNFVTAGQTVLTTLMKVNPVYVTFEADEAVFLRFSGMSGRGAPGASKRTGTSVEVGLADEPGYPAKGVVEFIDNRVNPQTGTIYARAVVDNRDRRFTPGLFARVRVAGTGTYPAALIDDRAVGTDQDRRFVLVVGPDGATQYRGVRLGPMSDGLRVVREGLKPGETIVVEGLQRVRPGMKVQPTAVPMDPKERPKPDPAAKK
jgi:RND family efflux transporter MFP subunit